MKTIIQTKKVLLGLVIFLFNACSQTIPNTPITTSSASILSTTFDNLYITYSQEIICLGDEITISFDNLQNSNCGNSQIQVSIDNGNTWTQLATGTPVDGILSYTYEPSSIGEYLYRGSWTRTGNPSICQGNNVKFKDTETLIPLTIEDCTCETKFYAEAISCSEYREANYYFSNEEDLNYVKIQGGLTNWTGDDAEITITGGNLIYSQRTPGNSSNRVITVEGSVLACELVTINIKWQSTNSNEVITGSWSAKDGDSQNVSEEIDGLMCN